MAEDISRQKIKGINLAVAYSIAFDESKDKGDIEQLALFCRYVGTVCTLFWATGRTDWVDTAKRPNTGGGHLWDCLELFERQRNKHHPPGVSGYWWRTKYDRSAEGFCGFTAEGAGQKAVDFSLHQEALCAQTFPPECTEVMNVVIQIVNKIIAKGLNHRQFRSLLDELESTCADLLLHNKVRWLSRGEVLKGFAACLEEVKTILGSKGLTFPELEQPEWLEKLHFMVGMTAHLNTALQGKGRTALHMEEVLAFERKLTVLARDLQKGTLSHFPNLKEFKEAHMINSEYLHSAVIAMQTSFGKRFCEFREEKNTLSFPVTPLSLDPSLLNTTAFAGVSAMCKLSSLLVI